jgi:hypothetical protein
MLAGWRVSVAGKAPQLAECAATTTAWSGSIARGTGIVARRSANWRALARRAVRAERQNRGAAGPDRRDRLGSAVAKEVRAIGQIERLHPRLPRTPDARRPRYIELHRHKIQG